MDSIVIVIGLTLLVGVSLGFWLSIRVTRLLVGAERDMWPGRSATYGHAVGAWWR